MTDDFLSDCREWSRCLLTQFAARHIGGFAQASAGEQKQLEQLAVRRTDGVAAAPENSNLICRTENAHVLRRAWAVLPSAWIRGDSAARCCSSQPNSTLKPA
jgi:hypothetical protein